MERWWGRGVVGVGFVVGWGDIVGVGRWCSRGVVGVGRWRGRVCSGWRDIVGVGRWWSRGE